MKAAMHDMLEFLCIRIECHLQRPRPAGRGLSTALRAFAELLNCPQGLFTTTIKLVVLLAAHGLPQ